MAIITQTQSLGRLAGSKGSLTLKVTSDAVAAPNSTTAGVTSQSAGAAINLPLVDASTMTLNEYVNIAGGFVGGGDLFTLVGSITTNTLSLPSVPFIAALTAGAVVQQLYRVNTNVVAQSVEIIDMTHNIRYWWNRSMGFGVTMKQAATGVITKLGRTGTANSTKGIYVYPNYLIVDPAIFVANSEFSIDIKY